MVLNVKYSREIATHESSSMHESIYDFYSYRIRIIYRMLFQVCEVSFLEVIIHVPENANTKILFFLLFLYKIVFVRAIYILNFSLR